MPEKFNLQAKLITYIFGVVVLATLPLLLVSIWWLGLTEPSQLMRLLTLLLVVWLAGLMAAYLISTKITQPIGNLNEAVKRFAEGDLEYQLQVEGEGEIRQLLISFNNMSVALRESLGYMNQYASDLQMELEEKQQLMEEQKHMYLNFIKSSAKALEAKDNYTHGHSERVAKFSVQICQQLDLDEETVEAIRIAATLHDIGKIGLQDAILLKPTYLTQDEYDLVKQHPDMGANILAPLQMDWLVLDGVEHHHERVDGTGYPAGLKAEDLSIAARVIAVADAYDAMTTSRPYRQALDQKVAIDELVRCQGTQFDSQVVAALIRSLANQAC